MTISDAANIDSSGVLLSSTKLKKISISRDKAVVSVEPGNRWRDVYGFLEQYGLSAVGGRDGDVGVPGFLLGGGISYFGEEYGFGSSSDNLHAIEVNPPPRHVPSRNRITNKASSACWPTALLSKQRQQTGTQTYSGLFKPAATPSATPPASTSTLS